MQNYLNAFSTKLCGSIIAYNNEDLIFTPDDVSANSWVIFTPMHIVNTTGTLVLFTFYVLSVRHFDDVYKYFFLKYL